MSAEIKFDAAKFREEARKLMAVTGKAEDAVLKQASKLFVRYAVRFTPPISDDAVGEEDGLKKSRKVGEEAVQRDIRRTYASIESVQAYSSPTNESVGRRLRSRVRNGDTAGVQSLLRSIGIERREVQVNPSASYHKSKRDRRGRVSSGILSAIVLRPSALKRYIRSKVARVGRAKAGWRKAAAAVGFRLPQWIARHADVPSGIYAEALSGQVKSITMGNVISYQGGFHPDKVIESAATQTQRTMARQAEEIAKKQMRRL